MEAEIPENDDGRSGQADWLTAPQQARSLETLARFLRAADELLQEKSFSAITIADIVARAERTVGSFYARFEDKDALVRTLAQERVIGVGHAFNEELQSLDLASSTVAEVVEVAVAAVVTAYAAESHVAKAALTLAASDEPARIFRTENYRMLSTALVEALAETVDAPEKPEIEQTVAMVVETVTAILECRILFGETGTKLPVEDTVTEVLDLARRLLD